jgi:hypothetical protein
MRTLDGHFNKGIPMHCASAFDIGQLGWTMDTATSIEEFNRRVLEDAAGPGVIIVKRKFPEKRPRVLT